MSEKVNFAWPVTSENALVYQHFQSEVDRLADILVVNRIVVFGAGIRGCCLLEILEKKGFVNIVFCDNNPEKQGNLINHYDILSLEAVLDYSNDQVFLIAPENSQSMSEQLNHAGLKEDQDWFSFDISVYDAYIAEYHRTASNPLLVMGDCAFSHISLNDENTDPLGNMIKAQLGSERCKVLAMHGIGHQANYHIINALLDQGERPSSVLLLTVLEVLTSKAHIMPRTQHPTLIQNLANTVKNPRESFIDYAKLTEERFNRFQVESFALSTNTSKSADDTSEKLFMKMNYLFKLREETEGVVYLKKIIRLFNELDIPITLYIPPVNYEQGARYFSSDFKTQYEANFGKLFQYLDNDDLKYSVIDASYLLNDIDFAAANTIDETSNYIGRKKQLSFLSRFEPFKQLSGKVGEYCD